MKFHRFTRNAGRTSLGDYVKPTPGSDPNTWAAIDRQPTEGWTPEVLQGLIAQANGFEDLDHLLFSCQYARDVTYNKDGTDAYNQRLRLADLMDRILATRRAWQQKQIDIALAAQNQFGWYASPLDVPAENYTGKSNDLTKYSQAIIKKFGGLSPVDTTQRLVEAKAEGAPVNLSAPEIIQYQQQQADLKAAQAKREAEKAAQIAAQAAAAANVKPTVSSNAVATQAVLDAQDAQHAANAAQAESNSVSGSPGASGIVKLLGFAFTLWTLGK
jgi:hypothetical protein